MSDYNRHEAGRGERNIKYERILDKRRRTKILDIKRRRDNTCSKTNIQNKCWVRRGRGMHITWTLVSVLGLLTRFSVFLKHLMNPSLVWKVEVPVPLQLTSPTQN